MSRRSDLYARLGLDPDRQGAHCVAADMIDQGGSAEDAELYLRGSSWLDARFPGGWGTTTTVKSNGVTSEILQHAIVPISTVAREEWCRAKTLSERLDAAGCEPEGAVTKRQVEMLARLREQGGLFVRGTDLRVCRGLEVGTVVIEEFPRMSGDWWVTPIVKEPV